MVAPKKNKDVEDEYVVSEENEQLSKTQIKAQMVAMQKPVSYKHITLPTNNTN